MIFLFFCIMGILMRCSNSDVIVKNLLDQQCRDNANRPVAWWYVYKPPAGVIHPSGLNFSFLTPDTNGRWIQSPVDITFDNMLSNTLMPTYKQRTYINRGGRAVAIFESRSDESSRTSARGVVMAARGGGYLLTHSVPGFPKLKSRSLFPLEEGENGHLLACVSLDVLALNKVARAIREIAANITYVSVPESLANLLPGWDFEENSVPNLYVSRLRPSIYNLIKVNESLLASDVNVSSNMEPVEAVLVARPPGVKSCIYSSFAARQLVMLNVYGQSRSTYLTTVCNDGFGVRNLESLCLKLEGPDGGSVSYVTRGVDYSWFAVSTAAHWQRRGAGPRQYWLCSGLVDKEDVAGEGGLLLCLHNFNLWVAFDNLKVTEPSCD